MDVDHVPSRAHNPLSIGSSARGDPVTITRTHAQSMVACVGRKLLDLWDNVGHGYEDAKSGSHLLPILQWRRLFGFLHEHEYEHDYACCAAAVPAAGFCSVKQLPWAIARVSLLLKSGHQKVHALVQC